MIEALVAQWGYLAVAIGTVLEGEAVLLVGAAMAHRGLLSLPLVGLSALVGSVVGDQFWFYVGRRSGRSFLAKRPRLAAGVATVERWTKRFGNGFVLSFRFLYGLRTLSPIVLGLTGFPVRRFAILNVIGAALWSAAFCAAGYGLGAALARVLGRATHLEEAALVAVLVAVVLWFIGRHRAARLRDNQKTHTIPSAPG